MMSRSHRSPTHDPRPDYSGALFYGMKSPSLNSSGFDTFAALSHPSLYEENLGFSPAGHSPLLYQQPHSPRSSSFFPENRGSIFPSAGPPDVVDMASYIAAPDQDAYWQRHAIGHEHSTPLPSPPLLSANSLNLPPLFTSDLSLKQNAPANSLYNYPAPPEIPYAESAVSAASSTLSPEDDESLNVRGPPDEGKRQRNLAASARFRQKKKLKEQQLENQTKNLCDRAAELEQRIQDLEQENQFLKVLLTEKETEMTSKDKQRFHELAATMNVGD